MGKPAGPLSAKGNRSQDRRRFNFRAAEKRARQHMGSDEERSAVYLQRKKEKEAKYAVFTKDWLVTADAAKTAFADDLFATTFSPDTLQKMVNAVKTATENEVSGSTRLLKDDYTYSIQITSHRTPHIPVHLSRM